MFTKNILVSFLSTGMQQMSDKVSGSPGSATWNCAICPFCPNVRATEISRDDIVLMDPLIPPSSRHDSHGAPAVAAAGEFISLLYFSK